jgi:hypothetical protein
MKINLKNGIDQLIFGMKQKMLPLYTVSQIEIIRMKMTTLFSHITPKNPFDILQEEEFKLGYMVASNPKLELFGNKVVNRKISEVKREQLQRSS